MKNKRYSRKNKNKKKIILVIVFTAVLVAVAAISYFVIFGQNGGIKTFDEKVTLLEDEIFSNDGPLISGEFTKSGYVVFFSVCDTKTRASVFSAADTTLAGAWEKAADTTRKYVQQTGLDPKWVKADIVDSMEKISQEELSKVLRPIRPEFFRKGISLDIYFKTAFLESEVNGNKLIDYDNDKLDLETINKYLKTFNRDTVFEIPDDVILFTCLGWFCDENKTVYPLLGYEGEEGLDYGRREGDVSYSGIEDVVLSASYWLANEVKKDGSFIYGYYPTYDRQFVAYNILRHAITIESLIWAYKLTEDEKLLPKIESTLKYLEDNIVYMDESTAFVADTPNDEIKLGGNAIAIIVFDLYMNTFNTDKYIDVCKKIGNGILYLEDEEKGTYYHVLNMDFSKKEEYRTVYYDGEATYALAILYGMTSEEKWLSAAEAAVNHFIEADYTVYRDHWVAYAMNEITKYVPKQEYFEFGLKNVQVNLDSIYNRNTSYHTYLELLMASYDMYMRMDKNSVPDWFDEDYFKRTIWRRAEHMLNGFLYPEYAMYLKNPERIEGTFCVRHDGYRVRIDDVTHFIAGYYHILTVYDELKS